MAGFLLPHRCHLLVSDCVQNSVNYERVGICDHGADFSSGQVIATSS